MLGQHVDTHHVVYLQCLVKEVSTTSRTCVIYLYQICIDFLGLTDTLHNY
jgi:hypothetical protein